MSTPSDFAAPPAEAPGDRRGCLKKSAIGCGVVAVVLAACFIAFLIYVRQRPDVLTDFVMRQVESHYAPDVTAEEKEGLRSAYAEFRTALREHRIQREPLDRMRATFVSNGSQGEVSRAQVRDLTELFRKAVAGEGAGAAPSPALTASPRATP